MNRIKFSKVSIIIALSLSLFLISKSITVAAEGFKYRCSNQIFKAFESENIEAFTRETGYRIDVKAYPSDVAVNLLSNGYCDLASTARQIDVRMEENGFKATPICSDPLAIIVNTKCEIDNVTDKQLEDIFSGDIKNWNELGGADLPIVVVIPAENTAANKNFKRWVMKNKEIKHTIVTATADLVIDVVNYLPMGGISFFSHAGASKYKEIKIIKINGISSKENSYPYIQLFYYVTKGEPTGQVKEFIKFTLSENGIQLIRKNGMIPLSR
jgi:phosphate transport system substrate-binding protein